MKIIDLKNKLGELMIPKKWEPIGTIKMFDREQDMSKLYYGTWELTLKERSPIGVNPNSTEDKFKTAGQQFGEKEHILNSEEIPSSIPRVRFAQAGEWSLGVWGNHNPDTDVWTGTMPGFYDISAGGQAHNNIHPVETVYFYKRIA